ncbi:LANO_0H13916g1_1 [Lachancea nothofagi CBS 11611]|uniref:LANO_0H13916g1_1 n=1 Tax=Lachancea nothofagi CBS 11611 TaxID=1266666 RepID=A0A1G4KMG6_9SACH|nr:LANO_0H13916g1_1 [Lachancea nothofagi CBS 11611]
MVLDTPLYSGFYTSQKLVDEFNMLDDNLPIALKEKDSTNSDDDNDYGKTSSASLIDANGTQHTQQVENSPLSPAVTVDQLNVAVVRNIDVLQHIFGTLSGKDRLAKILKYVLDLLKLFVGRSRASITKWDPQVLQYYSKVLAQFNLRLILKHPITIIKIITVAGLRNFEAKASLVGTSLSLFRQILRFGGTPFRVANLCHKIGTTMHQISRSKQVSVVSPNSSTHALSVVNKLWFNEATLSELIDFYYGVMDELMLLHKFKLWNHAGMYQWVAKHEALSWYYDIMLGLKKNWVSLQELNRAQLELEIQIQVKKRALELSSKLHGKAASPIKQQLLMDLHAGNNGNSQVLLRIQEIERERKVVMLDLMRLSFDFLADTTDVFNLKTPPGTYAVLSLASGLTGFTKLWGNAKKELQT